MTDTAVRLAGPTTIGTSETTLYTVPGSTTAILRSIRIVNSNGSQVSVKASIGADGIGTRIIANNFQIAPSGNWDWTGFLVMAAGETLRATAGTASALTITVSGVQVT